MNTLQLPRAYSESEAARLLSSLGWEVSTKTLQKARARKEITYRKLGGKIRYIEDDLKKFIDRGVEWASEKEEGGDSGNSRDTGSDEKPEATASMPTGTTLESERLAGALLMSSILRKPSRPSSHS